MITQFSFARKTVKIFGVGFPRVGFGIFKIHFETPSMLGGNFEFRHSITANEIVEKLQSGR